MIGLTPSFRTFSFGDLEGDVWGAAIFAGQTSIVFGTPDGTMSAIGPGAMRWSFLHGGWTLAGDGFELSITPARGADPGLGPAGAGILIDELCDVSGTLTAAGAEHGVPVRCLGTRSVGADIDPLSLHSVRGVSGWFAADQAVSLLALRPAESVSQQDDVLGATVFDGEGRIGVDEPRLSTTYLRGTPTRANLELWIGEGDAQFPRRATGEARGPGAEAVSSGFSLQVTPLRCHARGLDGAGVYLLARF